MTSHELARPHATRCRTEGKDVMLSTDLSARLVSLLDRVRVAKPPAVVADAHGAPLHADSAGRASHDGSVTCDSRASGNREVELDHSRLAS